MHSGLVRALVPVSLCLGLGLPGTVGHQRRDIVVVGTITDSLHGLVVESRRRGGHARWARVHGNRGSSAASLAESVMALDGAVDCRVIDVGGSELLTVGRFAGPVPDPVGGGEILVSRQAAGVA